MKTVLASTFVALTLATSLASTFATAAVMNEHTTKAQEEQARSNVANGAYGR